MQENQKKIRSDIFAVAIPMIVSAVSIPLLGIVDTAILGHLDSPVYLASINVGVTIFNMLFWSMAFLRMSTTGLVAQAHGKNDLVLVQKRLSQALAVALVLSFIFLIFKDFILLLALQLASNGGRVAELASEYYSVRIISAPATLTLMVLSGYFLALQQTKKVLVLVSLNQFLNMILDYVFVMEWGWGLKGVAWGSLISEYLALLCGVMFLQKQGFDLKHWVLVFNSIKSWKDVRDLFSVNRDIFIRTLCLIAVFTMMTKGSANLGEITLAANVVLMNFFYFMSYGLDGFAHAIESLCGKYYGAGDFQKFKQTLKQTFKISAWIALGFALFYGIFGEMIVSWLTSLQTVQSEASKYIFWMVIIALISMPSFVYDGVFVATTEAKIMRNTMVLAVIFCYIPLWYLCRPLGNHGLWLAFGGFFLIRTLSVHFYYRQWQKNWQTQLKNNSAT